MVSGMEKIMRLSVANLKKHKLETASMFLLVMLCMLLVGSSLSATLGIKSIFSQMMERTGSYENYIMIPSKYYVTEFQDILEENEHVERTAQSELLFTMSASFLDTSGNEQSAFMAFTTEDNQRKLENFDVQTTLSEAEIAALEHPIYMPLAAQTGLMRKPGDTFTLIIGMKRYEFTVAGFYETTFFDSTAGGLKMIVPNADFHALESTLNKYTVLAYDDHAGEGGVELIDDYLNTCQERSGNDIKSGAMAYYYESTKMGVTMPIETVLKIMLAMAAIIILAVAVMIRFRIASDIKEQLVSIGVLEALGYTSKEIAFSYVLEYLLAAAAGAVPGILGCFLLTPALYKVGELMTGHFVNGTVPLLPIVLTALGILVFVALIALIRAMMVRNYPPVKAFRKGQGDHRFGKNHLPLRDTKNNVHLRLAMKGFLQQFRQSLGLTLCITVATIAIVFSFTLFTFLGMSPSAIANSAGMEMSDLVVDLMPSVDAYAFAAELDAMPEVRKALPTTDFSFYVNAPDHNVTLLPMPFRDYQDTENIFPMEGRFPEHDNEIMITNVFARTEKVKTGDSLTLEYLNVKQRYLVCGIATCTTNGGVNLYITEDGLKRLIPTFAPDAVNVYLNEGVDADAFRRTLTERYGRSIADAAKDGTAEGSYEERIRAEAEKQIAQMMAVYGVTNVEYAIQVGDQVITGNSSSFMVRSIICYGDILRTQLAGTQAAISALTVIFIILAAVVVMIILFILMESSVRKQRRDLGIMKGMGYTSRELMLQLAARIMPASVCSVILGTVTGVLGTNLLTSIFGKIDINLPAVLLLDIALLVFCFGCAYFGARKIKKISVYELMTE